MHQSEEFALFDYSEDESNGEEKVHLNGKERCMYKADWSDTSIYNPSDEDICSVFEDLASLSSKVPISGEHESNGEVEGHVNGKVDWSDPSIYNPSDEDPGSVFEELAAPSSQVPTSGGQKLDGLVTSIDNLRTAFQESVLHVGVIESHIATQVKDALNQIVPCVINELKVELQNVMKEFHENCKSWLEDGCVAVGADDLASDDTCTEEGHRHLDGVFEIESVLKDTVNGANLKTRELSWDELEVTRSTGIDDKSFPSGIMVPPAHSPLLMALQGHWRNSSGVLYVVQGSNAHASLPCGLIAVTPLMDDGTCVFWCGRWLVRNSAGMCLQLPTKVEWEPLNSSEESVIWWRDHSCSVGSCLSGPTLASHQQDEHVLIVTQIDDEKACLKKLSKLFTQYMRLFCDRRDSVNLQI